MAEPIAIDYVSPLPPVRSGISDYSVDLLPFLDALCNLRVMCLEDLPIEETLRQHWKTAPADKTGQDGRLPVYQVGNNRYHEHVVALARARPGVLVLHDVVLHHLLVESTLGRARLEDYLHQLETDHGWVGELAARARRWGELGQAAMFALMANRSLLSGQRGVVVHSRWAMERLREEDPDLAVRVVPMGVPLPAAPEPEAGEAFRKRLGLDASTPLIGTFGFQTPIKRTEKVIESLALPGMDRVHLLIAGEVSPVLDFESAAAAASVEQRVHTTGFLDYGDFEAAIAACDLCVNLRYPTAGETSASLLRVLALGRPALVSDYAHGSELPDSVVVKVPLGQEEVETLAARVGALLADRSELEAMSHRARRYVELENDPAQAAARLVEACEEFAGRQPPGYSEPALVPPSSLLWRRISAELSVRGSDPPWPEGEARDLAVRLFNHGPSRWLPTRAGAGGLMVRLHWRPDPWSEECAETWVELPRELGPGGEFQWSIRTRRPLGCSMVVVEPHLKEVAGFNALGGPKWMRFV